jgi:hypothetical protein
MPLAPPVTIATRLFRSIGQSLVADDPRDEPGTGAHPGGTVASS